MEAASIHQRDIPTLVWYECVNVYVCLLVFAGYGQGVRVHWCLDYPRSHWESRVLFL